MKVFLLFIVIASIAGCASRENAYWGGVSQGVGQVVNGH